MFCMKINKQTNRLNKDSSIDSMTTRFHWNLVVMESILVFIPVL